MRHRFAVGLMGWVLGITAAIAPTGAAGIEGSISRLIQEAKASRDEQTLDDRIEKARGLLKQAGASLSPLPRDFLAADIQQAHGRTLVGFWRHDPVKTPARDQARRLLALALDAYERLLAECGRQMADIEAKYGAAAPSTDAEYRRLDALCARARFSAAWTRYGLGTTYDDPTFGEGAEHLRKAYDAFAEFTAVPDEGPERESLLKHPIINECFLGQALCLTELKTWNGRPSAAVILEVLAPIRPGICPAQAYKEICFLRIKACRATGSLRAAEDAAEGYFAQLPAAHRFDAIELSMALERAAVLRELAGAVQNSDNLAFRLRLERLKTQIYAYGDPWAAEMAQIVGEPPPPSPRKILEKAVAAFQAKDYEKALAEADEALSAFQDGGGPQLADVRYLRAAALWNLQRWRDAFLAAFEFARQYPTDARALGFCNRAAAAGAKALRETPPLESAEFQQFLTWAHGRFPDQPEVERGPWYLANHLLATGRFTEAERVLRNVPRESSIYGHAQYGVALALYRQAEAVADAPSRAKDLLLQGAAAVERFLDTAAAPVAEDERAIAEAAVRVGLAIVQRLLDLPGESPDRGISLLNKIDHWPYVGSLASGDRRALRLAVKIRSAPLEQILVDTDAMLLSPDLDDAQSGPALLSIADYLEKETTRRVSKDPGSAKQIDERLTRIYEHVLSQAQRSRDETLRRQTIPVRRRLGHALLRGDRPWDALPHFQEVLKHISQEQAGDVLRGLALAYEQTDRFNEATEPWGVLATGLERGTNEWLEARLHLIQCHWEAGHADRARQLMADFNTRFLQDLDDTWKQRFDALRRRQEDQSQGDNPQPDPGS